MGAVGQAHTRTADLRSQLHALQTEVEASTITGAGRRAATVHRVVLAHIRWAIAAGSLEYQKAHRTACSGLAGCSGDAYRGANAWLEARGIISRKHTGKFKLTTWRLNPAVLRLNLTMRDKPGTVVQGQEKEQSRAYVPGLSHHDAFRYGGLNHLTWHTLRIAPGSTIAELVNATGAHRRTVLRHLERLEEHGLVIRHANGTFAPVEDIALLDTAAHALGMVVRVKAMKARHDVDRQVFAAYQHSRNGAVPTRGHLVYRDTGEVVDTWTANRGSTSTGQQRTSGTIPTRTTQQPTLAPDTRAGLIHA